MVHHAHSLPPNASIKLSACSSGWNTCYSAGPLSSSSQKKSLLSLVWSMTWTSSISFSFLSPIHARLFCLWWCHHTPWAIAGQRVPCLCICCKLWLPPLHLLSHGITLITWAFYGSQGSVMQISFICCGKVQTWALHTYVPFFICKIGINGDAFWMTNCSAIVNPWSSRGRLNRYSPVSSSVQIGIVCLTNNWCCFIDITSAEHWPHTPFFLSTSICRLHQWHLGQTWSSINTSILQKLPYEHVFAVFPNLGQEIYQNTDLAMVWILVCLPFSVFVVWPLSMTWFD